MRLAGIDSPFSERSTFPGAAAHRVDLPNQVVERFIAAGEVEL